MTCPRRVDSLACISLLRFWLSHVALADTEWLRVESVRRGGEGKGPDKDARVLGSNPALLRNLSQLALLFKP